MFKLKSPRKLSNYLINPTLQMKYGLYFVIGFLIASGCIHTYLFVQLKDFMTDFTTVYPIITDHHLKIHDIFSQMIIATALSFVVLTFVVFAISIYFSHKIAGPAYVIRQSIEKLIEGNYEIRKNLREGDELNDIAFALNRLAEKYAKENPSSNVVTKS